MNETQRRKLASTELQRLGTRLRSARTTTLTEAGAEAGFRHSTLSKLERGKCASVESLIAYAHVLGLRLVLQKQRRQRL